MKYKLFFLVMSNFFIVVQSSYAMENKNSTLQIIKKLTAMDTKPIDVNQWSDPVKSFYAVKYVTNDSIVIGHNGGCNILDIKNDKEIKKISDVPCWNVAVHPNKKKIAFSADKAIKLYDIEMNKQEWSILEQYYANLMLFNACDNTILFRSAHGENSHVITRRDYSGHRCGDDDINLPYVDVALCPEKQMLCTVAMFGDVVSFYNSSDLALEPKKIKLTRGRYLYSMMGNRCCASSEGIIAVGVTGQNFIHIITSVNMDEHTITYLEAGSDEAFLQMLFYPRESVLLTVSEKLGTESEMLDTDKKICYWDVKTRQLIWTAEFPSCVNRWNPCSFSPDGKEVVFAFPEECVIYGVPFEVQYESDIKEKFPYLLFFLKNYIAQQHQEIPDVTRLLAYTCLETFRR